MITRAPTNKMRRRALFVMSVMILLGFIVLIFRLWNVQITHSAKYRRLAEKQQMREITLEPKRGSIYDRNMKVLAKSASAWTVFLSPIQIKRDATRLEIAEGLSKLLDVDKEIILEKSKKKTYYEVIKKQIEKPLADQVLEFIKKTKNTSIKVELGTKRYYPYEDFASNLLGFVGTENNGLAGVEAYCDRILRGKIGKIVSAKNAKSDDMPYKYDQLHEAEDGNSLVLCIDEVVQHFLEKRLTMAVEEYNVKNRASGIIMKTNGEVLAMASKPAFDPNKPREIDPAKKDEINKIADPEERAKALLDYQNWLWRIPDISDNNEPGSAFKIITSCMLLESGAAKLSDTYCCTGSITIEKQTIRCWKPGGHGPQDFQHAIMNSCNPWIINAVQKLGTQKHREYFKAFGFTELTGIELPGEAESIYHPMSIFKTIELSSSAMGQTFKITPIQLVTGVNAAINGGNLYQPHIVKKIISSDGKTIKNIEPILKRQVVSEDTSQKVANMCKYVIEGGSGRNARIAGYDIGGKTSTAEKIDKKVDGQVKHYVLGFLTFAPVKNPQVIIYVFLDEPADVGFASILAVPVGRDVTADVLPYLGIEPQYSPEELEHMDINIPHVTGENLNDAKARLEAKGLKYNIVGEENEGNTKVVKQVPAGGSKVPAGSIIMVYLSEDTAIVTKEVPDLTGCTASQANKLLGQRTLNMRASGADIKLKGTIVKSQDPPAGTEVVAGTVVTVEFINIERVE